MWKISKLQGYKNKWAVGDSQGVLRGYVVIDSAGKIAGNLDLSQEANTFGIVEEVQSLVADLIAEEQLLMTM